MEPLISLQAVNLQRQGISILTDVTFSFYPDRIYSIVGPNGAGKTSLLRLLALVDKPTAGQVVFQGTDIASLWPAVLERRRHIGVVSQHPLLFTATVTANLTLPLTWRRWPRLQVRRRVRELLGEFRLETLAGRLASRLSGGEAQKVALARAVAPHPHLLLLDEPTASLDPRNTLEFETLLHELHQRRHLTIILITHDLGQAARLSQELLFLHQGRLVESGPTSRVLSRPEKELTRLFLNRQLIV